MAVDYIEKNFALSSLSLKDVAVVASVSRWHLSRLFTRWFGTGFRDYLLSVRLRKAEELLACSSMSVKEVAAAVGFKHTSDLNRHLKRYVGKTPSAVRAKARAAASAS